MTDTYAILLIVNLFRANPDDPWDCDSSITMPITQEEYQRQYNIYKLPCFDGPFCLADERFADGQLIQQIITTNLAETLRQTIIFRILESEVDYATQINQN